MDRRRHRHTDRQWHRHFHQMDRHQCRRWYPGDPTGGDPTDPLLNDRELEVDSSGFVIRQQAAGGSETLLTRNEKGQPLTITLTDPDGSGPLSAPVSTYQYDANGNRTSASYPGGSSESWTFDTTLNRPLTHLSVLNGTTNYTWNANSTLASVTDPLGATTSYTYDAFGNVLTTTLPDPDGIGPSVAPVYQDAYDSYGRLQTATNPDSTTQTQVWNVVDRLASTADELGRDVVYDYDQFGRVDQITLPDPDGPTGPQAAPVVAYAYDALGRRTETTDVYGSVTTVTYNVAGQLESVTLPDPDGSTGPLTASTDHYTYDLLGRVISHTNALGGVSSSTYDADGNALTMTAPDPDGIGPLAAPTVSNVYDALGRLVSTTDPTNATTSLVYDAAGNVQSITNPLTLTSLASYDAAGNVASSTNDNGQTTTLAYDIVGRQTSSFSCCKLHVPTDSH